MKMMLKNINSVLSIAAVSAVSANYAVATGFPVGVVAPYVDLGLWPPVDLVAQSSASGIKHFNLAFITAKDASTCAGVWPGSVSVTQDSGPGDGSTWLNKIQAFRAAGGDVAMSFGGEAGIYLQQACSTPAALANEINRIVGIYSFDRIDFDIEGAGLQDTTSVDRLAAALAIVKAANPSLQITYTLPVLPSGLTAAGVYAVESAINAGVTLDTVNIMTMDFGDSFTSPMGENAVNAAKSLKSQLAASFAKKGKQVSDAQLWAMIGNTPMLGVNDVASNIFTVADAQTLAEFAGSVNMGMLSFWSIQRDCSSVSKVQQQTNEFSKTFVSAFISSPSKSPVTTAAPSTMAPTDIAPTDVPEKTAAPTNPVVRPTAITTSAPQTVATSAPATTDAPSSVSNQGLSTGSDANNLASTASSGHSPAMTITICTLLGVAAVGIVAFVVTKKMKSTEVANNDSASVSSTPSADAFDCHTPRESIDSIEL